MNFPFPAETPLPNMFSTDKANSNLMLNKTVLFLAELSQLGNDENDNVSIENIYIDDFKDAFEHTGIKVITGILFVYCIIFNNGFYFCMVLYD